MNKNKKGEITSKYLVSLIVLIASFVVILFVWYQFKWTGGVDKTSCHNSIVLRSSFNFKSEELGKKVIPLRCKTEKICLTMSGKECSEFGTSSKRSSVTIVKVKDKDDVVNAIADAIYDCHSMLGEGKLDFMNHRLNDVKSCLICARFALDEEAKNRLREISYLELYEFMERKQTSSGKNYLDYIYGVRNKENMGFILDRIIKEQKLEIQKENLKINLVGENAIVAGIIEKGNLMNWVSIIGGVGVVAVLTGGIAGASIATFAGAGTAGIIYTEVFPNEEYRYIPPFVYPYDFSTLKQMDCNSFETAP